MNRRRTCSQAPFKSKFRCVSNAGGLSAKMPQMWTNELGGRGAAAADERSTDSGCGGLAAAAAAAAP